ncbi:hypothetical protein Sm713_07450 [Streptomyces sp. TS71-3]|nr:hypothetical protein Sm713_07450 [Streptomyces sp. TS71-3]
MAKWQRGEPDDLAWLQDWCDTLHGHVAAGRSVRRARVISEPLSEYQRWSHSIADPVVEAGENIRWVPRRLVCSRCKDTPAPGAGGGRGGPVTDLSTAPEIGSAADAYFSYAHARPVWRYSSTGMGSTPARIRAV